MKNVGMLAVFNRQLMQDEGHGKGMRLAVLEERMRPWLRQEYAAMIFEAAGDAHARPAGLAARVADHGGGAGQ